MMGPRLGLEPIWALKLRCGDEQRPDPFERETETCPRSDSL